MRFIHAHRRKTVRWIGVLAATLVTVFAFAPPASAGTTLGSTRQFSCTALSTDVLYSCWYVTDTRGDFVIFGPASSCFTGIRSASNNSDCLVGHGYLHRLNSAGTSWAWRVYDDNCDATGPYFNSRTSDDGCNHYTGAAVSGSESGFHLNWGGAEDGNGVYYNPPTVVDSKIGFNCPSGTVRAGGGDTIGCTEFSFGTVFNDGGNRYEND
jgi:hypothetical protein